MSFWSDEKTDEMRGLWSEGHSASAIATRIGAPSRNAVIGKLHRLGLQRREVVRIKTALKAFTKAFKAKKPNTVKLSEVISRHSAVAKIKSDLAVQKAIEQRPDDVARVTFDELESHHCRYPIGETGQEGFGFCGDQKAEGLPYCACHAALCFDTARPRARIGAPRETVNRSAISVHTARHLVGA